jgi:hypothetical protein
LILLFRFKGLPDKKIPLPLDSLNKGTVADIKNHYGVISITKEFQDDLKGNVTQLIWLTPSHSIYISLKKLIYFYDTEDKISFITKDSSYFLRDLFDKSALDKLKKKNIKMYDEK